MSNYKAINVNTEELKLAFASLPPPPSPEAPPRHSWDRHRWEIRRHIEKSEDASNFLTWATVHATMFVGDVDYVQVELGSLLVWIPDHLHSSILSETEFGQAPRLANYPITSGNLVHQAYHLEVWEQTTGLFIGDMKNITEFGGGYGAMCLMTRRFGYSGTYVMFDLPEFLLLQRYYLSNVDDPRAKVLYVSPDHSAIGALVLPPNLFIACYSISEVPLIVRDAQLMRKYSSYLIAYHDIYNNIDNNEYFGDFADRNTDVDWTFVDKPFMQGHHYLIGKRKTT